MKNLFALASIVATVLLPGVLHAQTGDVIADLLFALEPPSGYVAPAATSSVTTATATAASTISASTTVASIYPPPLFSIGTEAAQSTVDASTIESMNALIASLTTQLYALIASSAKNVVASSTPVVATSTAKKEVFRRSLDVGSRGDDVKVLQDIMRARGLFTQESTGYFGAKTKNAVRTLQFESEIESTGMVGPKTRALLNTLVEDPTKGMTEVFDDSPQMSPPRERFDPLAIVSTEPIIDASTTTVSASITATPDTVPAGDSIELSWTSVNASLCIGSRGWSGAKGTAGTQTVPLLITDTEFVVTCTGTGGNARAAAAVVITPDITSPTLPSNVATKFTSSSRVDLSWSPSFDLVGIIGYAVERDSIQIASTTATSYTDSGVSAEKTYSYSVRAIDIAGNMSDPSFPVDVTTQK